MMTQPEPDQNEPMHRGESAQVPAYRVLSNEAITWSAIVLIVIGVGLATGLLIVFGNGRNPNQLDAIKTAGTFVVGTGGAGALWLTARRQRTTEIALHHADRAHALQQHVAAATQADAAERRITELYTKAADQLGSDKAPVRLAGLYALERLAQDNPAQRQTIVNVLCAYLRMPYTAPAYQAPAAGTFEAERIEHERRIEEKQVRLTAQRVVTAHLRPGSDVENPIDTFWPGVNLDFVGAILFDVNLANCHVRSADFAQVEFGGDSRFDGTCFTDDARFGGARFVGGATFKGAWFGRNAMFDNVEFGCNSTFSGAQFRRYARFSGARFVGDTWFYGVQFGGSARFDGALFSSIRFDESRFRGSARFDGAQFSGDARFGNSHFSGSARFDGAQFSGDARFSNSRFGGNARLDGALFNSIRLDGSLFSGSARFDGSKFTLNATFVHVKFSRDATFNSAQFAGGARFESSEFCGEVRFDNAQFSGIVDFAAATFAAARSDSVVEVGLPEIGSPWVRLDVPNVISPRSRWPVGLSVVPHAEKPAPGSPGSWGRLTAHQAPNSSDVAE
jgi:uncharacterized protein YjbI with pentapeptide repeats